MPTDTIKQIAKYKTRLASLERDLHSELAKLPGSYGFDSAEEFIAAFRQAVASRPGRKPKGAKTPKEAKAVRGKKGGRKKRAVITPEIEAKVQALAKAGKTGGEIAKAVGISLPSVQNLKKKFGLVKARGKAAKA